MDIRSLRRYGRTRLTDAPLDLSATVCGLEADLLLAQALGIPAERVFVHLDKQVAALDRQRYEALIARRAAGEPVAYILERREFYGRDFVVAPAVLIPRPETELLVEQTIRVCKTCLSAKSTAVRVIDVGTGSGCIPISVAAELATAGCAIERIQFVGIDISPAAIEVAYRNAQLHNLSETIEFVVADMLESFDSCKAGAEVEIVVSNPPYIAESEQLPLDVEHYEPRIALRSGQDGLLHIERLLRQWTERPARILLLEIGDGQDHRLESMLPRLGLRNFTFFKDLRGIRRVVEIRKEHA